MTSLFFVILSVSEESIRVFPHIGLYIHRLFALLRVTVMFRVTGGFRMRGYVGVFSPQRRALETSP